MANKKKVYESNEWKLSYKRNVVFSIVNLATQEINGIAGLSVEGVNSFKKVFDKNYHKGVLIEFVENSVYVDVYVNVLFGYSVKDVAFRVQENVKSSIESMTDFKVEKINVHVMGVVFNAGDEIAIM
ncbi:MAG: Asp23/Gls24 family envelope stress response protein [Clostridia bacterium]|nr:Asp23/Gls24 family envelope stress response protein [Clostridia bacterium]